VAVASAGPYANVHLIPDTLTMPASHSFLQAGCPSCHPTNSVKALKAILNLFHLIQNSDSTENAVQRQTVLKLGLTSTESVWSQWKKQWTRSLTALNCLTEPCRTWIELTNEYDESISGLRCISAEHDRVLSVTRMLLTPSS